jgi:hypothetical protein
MFRKIRNIRNLGNVYIRGPHFVMSRTDAQNGLDFHFKSHLRGVVILRPTFLVQDKMFRKFLKKILKNLNSLKKSLKLFKIPIFKDNSLKVRALQKT